MVWLPGDRLIAGGEIQNFSTSATSRVTPSPTARSLRGLDRLTLASDPTRDPTRKTAEGSILENPRPYRQLSGARDRARTGDPHVGKEMLGLILLRFFAQSGHIDAFRSIVGEAPEAGIESAKLAGQL
jgi:hypothetical protein